MTNRNITLHILYGIPCAGKSTAAIELACCWNLRTVIHTDYIREIQRGYACPVRAPALFKVTHNAWELYGLPTNQNIVSGFIDHANQVAPGIRIVAQKLVRDGFDAVIEGVHFHGGIIDDLSTLDGATIRATLLTVSSANELQQRVKDKEGRRAQGAEHKRWNENIATMLTIQDYLVSDARAHRIRVVDSAEWSFCGLGSCNTTRPRSRRDH